MNWFYYIDKPINYSSFDVIRVLKKQLNIKRIGHTWTLDPLATGGLLIAVWKYTKLIPYLEKDKKTYEFTINFDGITESFDLWTQVEYFSKDVIEKFKKQVDKDKIQEVLNKKFSWKIKQVAPKYSAKKINGERAYNLARSWKEFEIKANDVEIYNIEIIDYNFPKLTLKAEVSAWTYIRSIAYDLARELWLKWAYVSYLRRTLIEWLDVKQAQKLDNFNKEKYLNPKEIFKNIEFISLKSDIQEKINNWLKIKWDFDYIIWKDLFVINDEWFITNIVKYDWKLLVPIKRI
jgi:tRNA pseudouridine55 synthase